MQPHLDKRTSLLIERSNRIGVEFLVADLDMGLTFIRLGFSSTSTSVRARRLDKAFEAYSTVVRLLPRVVLSPDDRLTIDKKLEELKTSLESAGYSCER